VNLQGWSLPRGVGSWSLRSSWSPTCCLQGEAVSRLGEQRGGATYREGCATSRASVSEWPGGPASECERWLRCGNDDLNDSMRSSFGFCALVLLAVSQAVGPAGGRYTGGRRRAHITARWRRRRARTEGSRHTGCETWRQRSRGERDRQLGRIESWARSGRWGADYLEVVMRRSRRPRGSSQRSSHRALVHARSVHGPTLTWDAKGAWHRKRAVGSMV
jgi:hypothetical protein